MECDYARQSEYIAIFDADFQPEPDFLLRTVPFLLHNPEVALVQARWSFGTYSISCQLLSALFQLPIYHKCRGFSYGIEKYYGKYFLNLMANLSYMLPHFSISPQWNTFSIFRCFSCEKCTNKSYNQHKELGTDNLTVFWPQ